MDMGSMSMRLAMETVIASLLSLWLSMVSIQLDLVIYLSLAAPFSLYLQVLLFAILLLTGSTEIGVLFVKVFQLFVSSSQSLIFSLLPTNLALWGNSLSLIAYSVRVLAGEIMVWVQVAFYFIWEDSWVMTYFKDLFLVVIILAPSHISILISRSYSLWLWILTCYYRISFLKRLYFLATVYFALTFSRVSL
jgi:hypothetical protein